MTTNRQSPPPTSTAEQPLTEPQAAPQPPGTSGLRRYERPREVPPPVTPLADDELTPHDRLDEAIEASSLTPGSRDLLRGLLRLGRPAMFPGGGAGIEYSSLLKTAARPEYLGAHIREAAEHLHAAEVDLLVVPGMSGYPVGSMYAIVAGLPAVLLKKQKHVANDTAHGYPPGSFVIPSYTGEGDVVMSADLDAMQDIVDSILEPQIARQHDRDELTLTIRLAGADDIIDKATMSQAVSESALIVGEAAIATFVERHRAATGDTRSVSSSVRVVAWVTPLIKGYNRPQEHLMRWFGITPFAGLNVTSVHLDPPAVGIDGLGIAGFAPRTTPPNHP